MAGPAARSCSRSPSAPPTSPPTPTRKGPTTSSSTSPGSASRASPMSPAPGWTPCPGAPFTTHTHTHAPASQPEAAPEPAGNPADAISVAGRDAEPAPGCAGPAGAPARAAAHACAGSSAGSASGTAFGVAATPREPDRPGPHGSPSWPVAPLHPAVLGAFLQCVTELAVCDPSTGALLGRLDRTGHPGENPSHNQPAGPDGSGVPDRRARRSPGGSRRRRRRAGRKRPVRARGASPAAT
jgi:hypothetical protein